MKKVSKENRTGRAAEMRGGFTLVEVVVAIGILAVAVLPLIALMAIGVQANRESAERSRAALIAESIFSELRQSSAESGPIVRLKSDGPPDGQYWKGAGSLASLPGKAVYLAYDREGQVVNEYGEGTYGQGDPSAPLEVTSMVKVSFEDAASGGKLYGGAGSTIEESKGLIKVVVSVEYPVVARAESRLAYPFTTYMNLTNRAAVP
jgi:prepilin-type N-terminal cleavage/methylation domain-containing protein